MPICACTRWIIPQLVFNDVVQILDIICRLLTIIETYKFQSIYVAVCVHELVYVKTSAIERTIRALCMKYILHYTIPYNLFYVYIVIQCAVG